ncbi:MAG: endonuclease [Alphaproteobacteria bacterium HGW-Alphaproteobacteria-6]|nr:MAG: endonuclease [Alphaproteobacteria bacterium HGW-Alphaproteobacteria-6]
MGIPSRKPLHARHRDGPDRRNDRREAAAEQPLGRGRTPARLRFPTRLKAPLLAALALAAATAGAAAQSLRIATYDADLSRRGPGLMLRDIAAGKDAQAEAAAAAVAAVAPDILLLTGIDFDHDGAALDAFAGLLSARGLDYPYRFARRPNSGMATGLDLDGDGRAGAPRDAQGFGRFAGQNGMAILSRLPIDAEGARDFSDFLWRDLPGGLIADAGLAPEAVAIQRLSSTAHWDVPVILPDGGRLHLLAFRATPPVFDGPEDRNGRRNHDETAFWLRYLDGALPWAPPTAPFVILGNANLDPVDGDGRPAALAALLSDPRLRDPAPRGDHRRAEPGHRGDPALDTALFPDGPGGLRLDYVLPSAGLGVIAAGVLWPAEDAALAATLAQASRHRPVWVEIDLPR